MKDKILSFIAGIKTLLCLILIPTIFIAFIHSCMEESKYKREHPIYYSYVDALGNSGTTDRYCVEKGDMLLGTSDMTCKLNDGTITKVISFNKLRKGE